MKKERPEFNATSAAGKCEKKFQKDLGRDGPKICVLSTWPKSLTDFWSIHFGGWEGDTPSSKARVKRTENFSCPLTKRYQGLRFEDSQVILPAKINKINTLQMIIIESKVATTYQSQCPGYKSYKENMNHTQKKSNQQMVPEMTQLLKLVDKDFKATKL